MHADFVKRRLQECYAASITQKQAAAIRYKEGIYLEFSSARGHDLAIKSLENRTSGIRLLNVHEDEEQAITKATVYIPAGKESFFLKKVEAYASEKTKSGSPKNDTLVRSIDDIKIAILNSFWGGKAEDMPKDNPVWCEIWLRYDYKANNAEIWRETENNIVSICSENQIHIDEKHIIFPERIVKMVYANAEQLKLIIAVCPYIAEIRRAQEALMAYGLERTVYRLSISEYLERFTLKGGIFLYTLFNREFARAMRDIDLLAKNIPNNVEDKTKIPVSIDIGFDDVIYPDRVRMEFPVLLDMKVPEIYAYSILSVISEKFEAIVSLGNVNSRYKDFYDIYILASRYEFDDIFAFKDDFVASEIH